MSECHQRLLNEFRRSRSLETEEEAGKLSIRESTELNLSNTSNEELREHQESIEKFYRKRQK